MKAEEYIDKILSDKNWEKNSSGFLDCPQEIREQIYFASFLATRLGNLQKKHVPAPRMRKLYLTENVRGVKNSWANPIHTENSWIHPIHTENSWVNFLANSLAKLLTLKKLAISIAVIVVFLVATVYTTAYSLPGHALFPLKKAYENTRVKFAASQTEKLQFEIQIANQRLAEAEQAISKNDKTFQIAAINELRIQTKSTLNHLKEAASNPETAKNPEIIRPEMIRNVENLAVKQETLIAKVDPKSAQQNQTDNKKAISEIKNMILVSEERAVADIQPPKELIYKGKISEIKDDKIYIDKNIFVVNGETYISDKNGAMMFLSELGSKDEVTIKGVLKQDVNIAQSVTLIAKYKPEPKPEIKPETKQEHKQKTAAPEESVVKKEEQQQPEPTSPPPVKPKDTFGNVIIEAP